MTVVMLTLATGVVFADPIEFGPNNQVSVDCSQATYCQPIDGYLNSFFIKFYDYPNTTDLIKELNAWKKDVGRATYTAGGNVITFLGNNVVLNPDYVKSFTVSRGQVRISLPVKKGSWYKGMTEDQWEKVLEDYDFNQVNQ